MSLRIHCDEFAIAPRAWVVFIGDGETVHVIAHSFELLGDLRGELLFEVKTIRQILMMKARCVGGLLNVQAIVDATEQIVCHGGDDRRAAGSAKNIRHPGAAK